MWSDQLISSTLIYSTESREITHKVLFLPRGCQLRFGGKVGGEGRPMKKAVCLLSGMEWSLVKRGVEQEYLFFCKWL